uniref:Large ribosomal subunit protein mL40 n=1 Tax=Eptatretus burgeri TaxID=7764 RepID=A0A8C4NJH4_EPTBU
MQGAGGGLPWEWEPSAPYPPPPCASEPKKKKIVDPKRQMVIRERLKKKLRKLEKSPPQLIPISDFIHNRGPAQASSDGPVIRAQQATPQRNERALCSFRVDALFKSPSVPRAARSGNLSTSHTNAPSCVARPA